MKRKLQRHFSLTDKGIDNMMRASVSSFFKYVTFMLPPMIVFIFLNDMINSNLKPIAHYIGIIVIIAILMYLRCHLRRERKSPNRAREENQGAAALVLLNT